MTNFAAFPYMGQFGYGTPPFAPPGTPDPQQGSGTFPQLPSPPPHGGMGLSGSTATASANLPAPPPRKRGQLFDKDHRQETLLAIAAGFGSGSNFGEGASNMARNLLALKQGIRAEDRKDNTFGGPDNAFEITTDPTTGARTVREVPEFAGYLEKKRQKAKDVADLNGRAMSALLALPEDQRPGPMTTCGPTRPNTASSRQPCPPSTTRITCPSPPEWGRPSRRPWPPISGLKTR